MEEIKRKLASIQVIDTISPIVGADRVEMATLVGMDWQCVVGKKDNLKSGSTVIYFEVDSILPEKPEYEFLRSVKFRIKTRKFLGQISQGLILPVTEALKDNPAGDDVTDLLGVIKHDPQAQEESELVVEEKHRSVVMKFLMGITPFRYVYLKLNTQIKGNWPSHACSQTDEVPIQKCAKILMEHFNEEWYVSEKLEGQSGSFFTHFIRVWGFLRKEFGVCSRKIWLKTKNNSNYWQMAEKYDLNAILMAQKLPTVLQGEIVGGKIQGNIYKLGGMDLYLFNIIVNGTQLSLEQSEEFCKEYGLKYVPILDRSFVPEKVIGSGKTVKEVVDWLLNYSNGKTVMLDKNGKPSDVLREGVVIRLKSNPRISFKVRSPEYLILHGE